MRVLLALPRYANEFYHQLHVDSIKRAFVTHECEEHCVTGPRRDLTDLVKASRPDILVHWPGWDLLDKPDGTFVIRVTSDLHGETPATRQMLASLPDLILVRAPAFVSYFPGTEARWLRWSVDETCIPPWVDWDARKAVGFVGSLCPYTYPQRTHAVDALGDAIDVYHNRGPERAAVPSYRRATLPYAQMLAWLSGYRTGVACSSRYRFPVAKHLEIAAAGVCLLTDGLADGLDSLLPKSCYLTYDATTDMAALVASATEEVARAARAHVLAHHTHEKRAAELRGIVSSLMGQPV